jgi:hypothetical protein
MEAGVRVDRETFRKEFVENNAAWAFGAGWLPIASDPSVVRVESGKDGEHSRRAMLLTGEATATCGLQQKRNSV